MRAILTFSLALVCGMLSCPAKPATTSGPATTSSGKGVSLAITTAGYDFTPTIGSLIPPPVTSTTTPPATLPKQGFNASVLLENNTAGGIACALNSTGTPGERFEFTLIDANGKVVWDSLPTVLPPLTVQVTLGAGDSWRGAVFVPLVANGQAVPAGTYTLQATLYGSPTFVAVTTVVVHPAITVN